MPNKQIPTIGDPNWGTPLNAHLSQLQNPTNGGINSFEQFSGRPTTLTLGDIGKTYIYTQTGNLHQWTGNSWKVLNESVINVKDYGAVGDFDPETGLGTNDRTAIQSCFDKAISIKGGCTVVFPSGRYYGGSQNGTFEGAVAIRLGTVTPNSAYNINIKGEGAELYQGNVGRFFGIFGANNVKISGLKIVGFAGGPFDSSRENDAILTVNYNSTNVTIENCYLTNSLGDCILAGGSLTLGGELGHECKNIIIRNNRLKERIGNGVASNLGGTTSRLCVAIIDCIGVKIHNNIIYGSLDFEPNLNGQHIIECEVYNNTFKSGNVSPESSLTSNFWADEKIDQTNGVKILQRVVWTSTPASPIVKNCLVNDNTFDYGIISFYAVNLIDSVANNLFQSGQINYGSTTGPNYSYYCNIVNNIAKGPLGLEDTFIKITGSFARSNFSGNIAYGGSGFKYCINNIPVDANGKSSIDLGRSSYINNIINGDGAIAAIGFTPNANSFVTGNTLL